VRWAPGSGAKGPWRAPLAAVKRSRTRHPHSANRGMDEDNEMHGFTAEQVERIMEHVAQARDGLITASQLTARIERIAGVRFKP
jgi:hypothetical protein